MELINAQEITKTYDHFYALDRVNIRINEGSIFGLLGPNGAGKTTFIRIITKILAPDSGFVFFNGRKMVPEDIYEIGYLPEERGLYKKMKVRELAVYLAQLKGVPKSIAKERIDFWLRRFELKAWSDKKVEELSKGMQQKLQFIVTIVHQPKLLIFDEPFSGFDPINANLIKEEIITLKKEGATVIFSTHDMNSVEELCDDITLINKAKNILSGDLIDIKERYKTNVFQILCKGSYEQVKSSIPQEFELLSHQEKRDDMFEVQIKAASEAQRNDLLRSVMAGVEVISFNEVIPRLNDIFISAVQAE